MMRRQGPRCSLVLLALAALLAASMAACHKSAEQEAGEGAHATAARDGEAAKPLLVDSQDAGENAARESNDVFAAVSRERDRFRVLLTKEIGWIDRRVIDMERVSLSVEGAERLEKEREIVAAREWRERLRQDLEVLEHPPPGTDWTGLKERIERDLDENRPPTIPRSYEKPYGI